ncbi:MAG: UvrD-helicase domain-containing protein, partial [Candidatus Melainabacteria bacterium]|nr:UvrD-helicase domain-containing protein [Candidatus Melainabacteria bacterium]
QLVAKLLPLIDSAKDPSKIFLRVARDLKEKRDALLESQEKFSPDDLLLKVEKALALPEFVERVQKKYRAAIIDEFQDTDPVQWNIFQKLFLSHNTAVTLVGDPKQSIYGFRNADVYTYLQAADAMGEKAKKHLDTNYRSTPALVSALNHLFSHADWMRLPGRGALAVLPVQAGKQAAPDAAAPITFFVAEGEKSSERMQKKVLPFLASEISILHETIPYHEIAILVKDRFQGANVVDYLKDCGIPASFKRGASITDSIAYAAFKEVLVAVCFPYDMGKIKTALGSPLFGWTDEELRNESDALLTAKAQMQSLHDVLMEKGMGPFFNELLHLVLENLLSNGGLSLYLDLRKISELLIEEEVQRGLKGEAFLLFLSELAADAHLDESRLKTPSQEEKGSVTVMTMHMSKGLEFEAVFALGVASRHKISEQIVVKKEGTSVIMPLDPDDPACQAAIEEIEAEKLRQLYVALTRAKSRLYIPLIIEEPKLLKPGEASPIELFFSALGGDAQGIFGKDPQLFRFCQLEEVLELPKVASIAAVELPHVELLHLPRWEDQLFSFTMLAKKEHSTESLTLPTDTSPSPHTLPHGSETGHILHLLFEKIFKRGLNRSLDPEAIEKIIEEHVAFSSLESFKPILLPWVVDLLKKPIAGFSLADVDKFQQEMEFFFPVKGGMMKGFADLFFEQGGKYYLLDWKSNYLGPTDADYTEEKIVAVMRQNDYFLQASIYAEALKRFVKLFDNRPFSECFGGAVYYFVRGKAPYHFIPEVTQ